MEPVPCCTVCVEPYSAKAPKYACDECGYEACRVCVLRYVEGGDHEPKCMGCGHMWSREFLFGTMSPAVYKRMIDKSVSVEVLRQKAMLASTVPLVEMERERDAANEKVRALQCQIADLSIQMSNWQHIATNLQANMTAFAQGRVAAASSSRPTRVFLGRCSQGECRGFVDAVTQVCAVCDTKHCWHCLEEQGEGHECDENLVENIRALRTTCKACPKCYAPIQKIHGCNDMFCVACATAFCWRTLKIHENGNSNPHYYEWLRDERVRGIIHDRRGGQRVNTGESRFMRSEYFKSLRFRHRDLIASVLQTMAHQRQMIANLTERHTAQTRQTKATYERAAYLVKRIDDKEFQKRIKRLQTDAEHAEMIGNTRVMLDRARTAIIEMTAESSVESTIEEVAGIVREYNARHADIAKIFSRKQFASMKVDV